MLLEIISPALATDTGVQLNAGFSEISWTIIIPLLINAAMLAYLFGGLAQKLKSVESDVDEMQKELEKLRDANVRSEGNLHRMELILSKIETRFDMFLTAASEHSKCPLLKSSVSPKSNNQSSQEKSYE